MAEDLDGRRRAAAELGADIAHEFKNPLATIAASAELLVTSPALTPERVDLVARSIGESVERLRRSIDDLMELLRLEHAITAEAREPVATGAFLEQLADEYRRDPKAAGWTFAVEATPEAAAAAPVINRRRWQEMLRNLVDNALVQPAADRRIVLGARLDKRRLVTWVTRRRPGDLGGEPEEDLPPLLHAAAARRGAGHRPRPVDRRERRARARREGRGGITAGAGRDVPRDAPALIDQTACARINCDEWVKAPVCPRPAQRGEGKGEGTSLADYARAGGCGSLRA